MSRLPDALHRAASKHGHARRLEIPLTALSCALLLAKEPDGDRIMAQLVERADVAYTAGLTVIAGTRSEHVAQDLMGWLDELEPSMTEDLRACLVVLAGVDLAAIAEREDVLGYVYGELRGKWDREAFEAFYTPRSVSRILAMVNVGDGRGCPPGTQHYDGCVGTGALLIATAMVLREQGIDPATERWYCQDIDALALALAQVNFTYYGMVDPARNLVSEVWRPVPVTAQPE